MIKVDSFLRKREETFKESFFPLPQTPSPFFKPFCGIHVFEIKNTNAIIKNEYFGICSENN